MPNARTGSSDAADAVVHIADCRLRVGARTWTFAEANADAIDAHWQRRHRENPQMFNGVIHLVVAADLSGSVFDAEFLRTDFKSYLYWREQGFPEAGVRDGFGSALIRSAEGHVILGRQRAGNVNAGLAYLPGGFIDPRDVSADGTIDIDASILRETAEETGLGPGDFAVQPGYHLTSIGPLRSLAREVRSPLPADALRARILSHFAGDPHSELTDAVIVRTAADLDGADIAPYARLLLRHLLA